MRSVATWGDMRRAAHVDRVLLELYSTARDFLEANDRFHGGVAHVAAADGRTFCACCAACRSKGLPRSRNWLRYPLVVGVLEDATVPWTAFPTCGCSPTAIAAELLRSDRARIDAQIAALEAA